MFFCYGRTWGTSLHCRMFRTHQGYVPTFSDFTDAPGVRHYIVGCFRNPTKKGEGIQSSSDVKPGIAKRLNYIRKERINALSMKSVCGGTDRGGSLAYLSIPT